MAGGPVGNERVIWVDPTGRYTCPASDSSAMADRELVDYYEAIVDGYEDTYEADDLRPHLQSIGKAIGPRLAGHSVLEIACGTGYWTRLLIRHAGSVIALDAGRAVLNTARAETPMDAQVSYIQGDAYRPPLSDDFTAGFCAFWWSHVPTDRIDEFLNEFHSNLDGRAIVCMIDNRPRPEFAPDGTDETGRTYVCQELDDGSTYRLHKRFPDERMIRAELEGHAERVTYDEFGPFWMVAYRVPE